MRTPQETIKQALGTARSITKNLLAELSDADLLVRPIPQANHIAWQLGHLICTEQRMVGAVAGARQPALPDGFAERHAPEASTSDDASTFETKARYIELLDAVRDGTIDLLDRITPEGMAAPAPEAARSMCATVGQMLVLMGGHELLHAGQWSVLRRKLGLAPVF